MRNLNVAIKTPYFDSINAGIKTTEYRDVTQYWIEKLVDFAKYPNMTWEQIKEHLRKGGKLYPQRYDTITFHNNNRHLIMEVKDIVTYNHHTTFAIKLGKRKD